MKTAVMNSNRALPGVLLGMDNDFWKEWAELRATIATLQSQQGYLSAGVLRIEHSETAAAGKRTEIERQLTAISARLDGLEGKGLAAWTAKRVTQLAGLVAMMGAIFGGVFGAVSWLIAHYK